MPASKFQRVVSSFDSVTSVYDCQQVLVGWIRLNLVACTCKACEVVLQIRSPPQQVAQRSHSLECVDVDPRQPVLVVWQGHTSVCTLVE